MSSFARNSIGPTRWVQDAAGTFWSVCEVTFALDRRAGRSLLFESDGVIRRVRNYPEAWYELSDADLVQLIDRL